MSRRRSHAQSLVEFALVLPVVLMLFVGTIEMSIGVFAWIDLLNSVQIGAQYAAKHGSDSSAPVSVAQVQSVTIASLMPVTTGTTTISVSPATWSRDTAVTVSGSRPVGILIRYVLGGQLLTVTAAATVFAE